MKEMIKWDGGKKGGQNKGGCRLQVDKPRETRATMRTTAT